MPVHAARGVGALHAPRAVPGGVGELDEVDASDVAQQPQGFVADAEHTQRVAGRMVGDPVGKYAPTSSVPTPSTSSSDSSYMWSSDASAAAARPASPYRCATIVCWWRTDPTQDPEGATTTSQSANTST